VNSRERLLKALACETPDRVPISTYNLCGYNSKSWENHEESYSGLMDCIREKTDCIAMWGPSSDETFFGTSYNMPCNVQEVRGLDWVSRRYTIETPKGVLTRECKEYDSVHTIWNTEHWCKDIDDVDMALSVPYKPVDYDFSDYKRLKEEVGNHGIIMTSIADPLCCAIELMEFGEATIWAMTETEHFAKTVEVMHERVMENLRNMLDKQVVDLYRIYGPEYATIPYLPPKYFERFVTPYVREMVDLIHSRGAKARVHSHGKIRNILSMILDTGADAIDPCEAPPDGDITLREVKDLTKGRLCLFGNLQLKLLEHGKVTEVREAVKRCMEDAMAQGGYVITPTAAPINVPLSEKTEENYYAFIDAAQEYGRY